MTKEQYEALPVESKQLIAMLALIVGETPRSNATAAEAARRCPTLLSVADMFRRQDFSTSMRDIQGDIAAALAAEFCACVLTEWAKEHDCV